MIPVTTLAQLLPSAADRAPGGVAIRDQGTSITWADADRQAGRLAAVLAESGVSAGDRVGVHLRKCAQGFVAMHAVVRLGAVAVPLDPTASADYLGAVATRTGCRALVTHEPCRPTALATAERAAIGVVVGLDASPSASASAAAPAGPAPIRIVSPGEVDAADGIGPASFDDEVPAYLITTSGSTGSPKAICHTHRSALAYVAMKLDAFDLGPDDRISDLAPHHFDISTLALWVTPTITATNIVLPETHQLFPATLSATMADERLTTWYGVPYLLTQLLTRGQLADRDLSSLRWVLFGGEVTPPAMLAEVMAHLPAARFANVYGPAETNACAIGFVPGPPVGDDPVPIGRPIGPTRIELVDPTTADDDPRPVPVGDQGEIWVAGPTTMAGYWDDEALTSVAIRRWRGERWYRTGDLGIERADGELVFDGRVDHQVKIRGYRVELESIETVLESVPGVVSAVATVDRSPDGSDVVIVGVALDEERLGATDELPTARLTDAARAELPAYAIPRAFYRLASTPVTGSGKLDRRAIRLDLLDHHGRRAGRREGEGEVSAHG